eukprot:528094-Pelagomonas_calceolata.AAC.2
MSMYAGQQPVCIKGGQQPALIPTVSSASCSKPKATKLVWIWRLVSHLSRHVFRLPVSSLSRSPIMSL